MGNNTQNQQKRKLLKDAIEDLKKGEAAIIQCPECERYSFIGIGQAYTSDNRPYPLGTCCYCEMDLKPLDNEADIELMMEFRSYHWEKWVLHCLEHNYQPEIVEGEDTKEVVIGGKRFHFETDRDDTGYLTSVSLTECGEPDEIEMLEAYDLYL